jgi:hypothetical protein
MPALTLSRKSSMALLKLHLPLRERCKVNLTIFIKPGVESEFEHIIVTPGLQYSANDPCTPDSDSEDDDDDDDMDTEEEHEVACLVAVIQTFCSSWTAIRSKCGSSPVWYPCHCKTSWAHKRAAEPINVLQVTYSISHLQLIIPGLYVAFLPDDADDILCHSNILLPEREFTHHINIITIAQMYPPSEVGHAIETTSFCCAVKRLQVCVLDTAGETHPGTRLSPPQLGFARDFLSLALSYPACMSGRYGSKAKVLITTSTSCPDDAMAIVACFMAYSFGEPITNLARCFDSEQNIDQKWLGLLTDHQSLAVIEEGLREGL